MALRRLHQKADAAFARVAQAHPGEVRCTEGCDDCCHALFDLSPIEAVALAKTACALPRNLRRRLLRRASKAAAEFDRAMAAALGQGPSGRQAALSRARVACPLLENKRCLLYDSRPTTCRLYGLPVKIKGRARTCHLSGFRPGRSYPTADLAEAEAQMQPLSRQLTAKLPFLTSMRRDVARALMLSASHGPALRALED